MKKKKITQKQRAEYKELRRLVKNNLNKMRAAMKATDFTYPMHDAFSSGPASGNVVAGAVSVKVDYPERDKLIATIKNLSELLK